MGFLFLFSPLDKVVMKDHPEINGTDNYDKTTDQKEN